MLKYYFATSFYAIRNLTDKTHTQFYVSNIIPRIGEPLKTERCLLDREIINVKIKQPVLSGKRSTINEQEIMYRFVSREFKPSERYTKHE